MNALLELDGVDVIFRRGSRTFQALHEVNLALFAGERVGLVGGSGSGKTTILRTLLGLIRPAAGEVRFDGRKIDPFLCSLRERELVDPSSMPPIRPDSFQIMQIVLHLGNGASAS